MGEVSLLLWGKKSLHTGQEGSNPSWPVCGGVGALPPPRTPARRATPLVRGAPSGTVCRDFFPHSNKLTSPTSPLYVYCCGNRNVLAHLLSTFIAVYRYVVKVITIITITMMITTITIMTMMMITRWVFVCHPTWVFTAGQRRNFHFLLSGHNLLHLFYFKFLSGHILLNFFYGINKDHLRSDIFANLPAFKHFPKVSRNRRNDKIN